MQLSVTDWDNAFHCYCHNQHWDGLHQPLLYSIVAELPFSHMGFAATQDMKQRLTLIITVPAPLVSVAILDGAME